MNKYRVSNMYDEYDENICLKCMGKFTSKSVFNEGWIFCPLCGTKWDGIFSKQHKRYPYHIYSKPIRDWRNPGYQTSATTGEVIQSDEPRLIIEYGFFRDSKLSEYGFCSVFTTPKLYWSLYSHVTSGRFINGKSSFVHMYHSYINKLNIVNPEGQLSYPNLRLIYIHGTYRKIIKQRLQNDR